MNKFQKFAVVGSGAWGTALACVLKSAGRDVILWGRQEQIVEEINKTHENKAHLAGIALDPSLLATANFEELKDCDAVLLVVPTQYVRETVRRLAAKKIDKEVPIIVCCKGIERETKELPATVVAEEFSENPVFVLSGPNFAREIAQGLPAAATLAGKDEELGSCLAKAMGSTGFRPYVSTDVVGAQIGGAIKNILAIACGIAVGKKLGENARAALITRGLSEMTRLGLAMGAQAVTLMGLSGLGDLVLTCSSPQSRNMSLGIELGRGRALQEILSERTSVAEGVFSAAAAMELSRHYKIEMPITEAVDAILNRGAEMEATINGLLTRPLKNEIA